MTSFKNQATEDVFNNEQYCTCIAPPPFKYYTLAASLKTKHKAFYLSEYLPAQTLCH